MVAVISSSGKPLMPTTNCRARILLKKKRAVIFKHSPVFTVQLTDREDGDTQPIEYASDVGYAHVGISIKSQKHEYVSEQRDLLNDETERHDTSRKMRRQRRNRKRYRKPRFDNRRVGKEWLAPGIRNKANVQVGLFKAYLSVFPITKACFEMGTFDTQLLQAIESGQEPPKGKDYQHGPRYQMETLRQAVFSRDKYACVFCGRKVGDSPSPVLHIHHLGFRKGDHTNRMGNLATVCERCHTPANHKPGGILYDAEPTLKPFKGATFMSVIRWQMLDMVKAVIKNAGGNVDVHISYGARTKRTRKKLHIEKSHANDAYAIGEFHPRHRAVTAIYQKRRRNNRVLEKFYGAKYIDSRDGKKKSGQELFSGRSKRNKNLSGENLHKYRRQKVSKGRRTIRKAHYLIQPGTVLLVGNEKYTAKGVHCNGTRVMLDNKKSVAVKDVKVVKYAGGWIPQKGGTAFIPPPIEAGVSCRNLDEQVENIFVLFREWVS